MFDDDRTSAAECLNHVEINILLHFSFDRKLNSRKCVLLRFDEMRLEFGENAKLDNAKLRKRNDFQWNEKLFCEFV